MKPEPLNARIDRALAWLATHRQALDAALPLRVGPTTYLPGCLEKLDIWVARYHQGQLNKLMATAYVLEPIRNLYRGFNDASRQP